MTQPQPANDHIEPAINDNFSLPGHDDIPYILQLGLVGRSPVKQKKFLVDLYCSGLMKNCMTQRDFDLLFLDLELREI